MMKIKVLELYPSFFRGLVGKGVNVDTGEILYLVNHEIELKDILDDDGVALVGGISWSYIPASEMPMLKK